jgi:hypothetical protein
VNAAFALGFVKEAYRALSVMEKEGVSMDRAFGALRSRLIAIMRRDNLQNALQGESPSSKRVGASMSRVQAASRILRGSSHSDAKRVVKQMQEVWPKGESINPNELGRNLGFIIESVERVPGRGI